MKNAENRIGRRRRRKRRRRRRRRRGRRRRNQQSLHLPEEIIEEILSILPVKSLLRFRCVSKTWWSLIGSKRFIKAHHQNSIKNPSSPHQRLITLGECSLQSLLSEAPISRYSLEITTLLAPLQIWGCCNGLFCVLSERPERVYLWNPSTRTSKKLPEISSPGHVRNYGFGWVESSDEYKVFVLLVDYDYYRGIDNWVGKVYSSKTKSWKTIELSGYLRVSWGRGVFAGGKLYWKNHQDKEIIFLDLKNEVFGRIELPCDQDMYGIVDVLGGFLCVLCFNDQITGIRGIRVWVMKESWEKVVTLSHLLELLQPPMVKCLNGDILVYCGSFVLVYDCRDNVFCKLNIISHCVYVESLVSPEDL
ncbi:F-box/kelch-repeat protein At3g23880-like [Salvia miltiorrhiza]|uniref:F-box/kelch-repeat protein At3g23880-like n=1 Tax=Salvia miltiorrhiza TaxID=226208 RepID=UPI0025ACF593|nr:F-box/kelch-repeat protein At3g23880-like [Salvia miltiorrhiza]